MIPLQIGAVVAIVVLGIAVVWSRLRYYRESFQEEERGIVPDIKCDICGEPLRFTSDLSMSLIPHTCSPLHYLPGDREE